MTRGNMETQGFNYTRIVEVIGHNGEMHQGGTDNRKQVKHGKTNHKRVRTAQDEV